MTKENLYDRVNSRLGNFFHTAAKRFGGEAENESNYQYFLITNVGSLISCVFILSEHKKFESQSDEKFFCSKPGGAGACELTHRATKMDYFKLKILGARGEQLFKKGERVMKKISVVIAEDNIQVCNMLNDYLRFEEAFELVGFARDGKEAIKLAQKAEPDVVILDLVLPEIDGIGVMQRLKGMHLENSPLVVVLTDNPSPDMARLAYEQGAELIMRNPFDPANLAEQIKRLMEIKELNKTGENACTNTDEYKIISFLNSMGMPSHLIGYQFLVDALLMAMEKPDTLSMITKKMYPRIASKNKTSGENVERRIRHVIEVSWQHSGKLKEMFGNNIKRPTNTEFIASILQRIRLENYVCQFV